MKGTIRVRTTADGRKRYACQVFAGVDPRTGRKRYLTATAGTEREAHRLVHQLVAQVDAGQVPRESATLTDLIKAWLETAGPPGENSRAAYENYAVNYIAEEIGRIRVGKLRVEDLDRWHAELRRRGLGPATIRKAHNIVRGALTQGLKWGWVTTNVAVHSKPPPVPKPVVNTPTAKDVAALLAHVKEIDPEFYVYLRLAAVTGARPGEMCALQWPDVSWGDAELDIRRRIIRAGGEALVKELTKTGKIRRIPLDHRTLDILDAHRQEMEARAQTCGGTLQDGAFIFSDTVDGSGHWRPDSVSRRFRLACDDFGAMGFTLYSIRHQAATTMIDQGIDAKTVSDRLGNSVATVLGTYTRARSTADRAAADLMGSLLDV